jgi:hypothetical protein
MAGEMDDQNYSKMMQHYVQICVKKHLNHSLNRYYCKGMKNNEVDQESMCQFEIIAQDTLQEWLTLAL